MAPPDSQWTGGAGLWMLGGMTKAAWCGRAGAAAASGLLVAAIFPPLDATWLVWLGLIPLLAALRGFADAKRARWAGFGLGLAGGLASCLVQFQWISTVSWLGALVLPLYLSLYWAAFGAFAARVSSRSPVRDAFCLAAVWAGLEWLRGWLLTGFGWNALGVGFHDCRSLAQGADLLGVAGLSAVAVFVQALLVRAAGDFLRLHKPPVREILIAGGVVIGLVGYGKFRIAEEKSAESVRLKALLVQLNIPQEASRMLWTDLETHQAYEDDTLRALDALKSADGSPSAAWPDWVVWPEIALTGRILRTDAGEWGTWQINQDTLAQVRAAGPFSLIFGAVEDQAKLENDQLVPIPDGKTYNALAAMTPDDALQTYGKHHLVIFGETIPFLDQLPWLKAIYEQQSGTTYGGSFTPGASLEPLPLPVGDTTVGAIPTVCFEDSVPRLTRKFVRPGPQVIVNVTNDGWFKQSAAADQHFQYARFRAIELRRPMLRCANTGVSAAIDSTGSTAHPDSGKPQVLTDAAGSHFTRGTLLTELRVPLRPAFSLYAAIGDWGVIALGLAGLGLSRRKLPAAAVRG